MTLVVARIDGPHIAIASDTLLTEHGKALPTQKGTIKSCLLGNVCISFSNSPELAEVEFKRFAAQHKNGAGFAETIAFFEQSSRNTENDYIVAFDNPPRLIKIADGKRQGSVAKTVWIGDHSAYQAFRAYEAKIRAKTEHGRAINAVIFADEQTGSPASDLYSVMRNVVSDRGVGSVGGFVSVVSNRGNGFRFSVYSDMLFNWVNPQSANYTFALTDRVDLQTSGENSGYNANTMSNPILTSLSSVGTSRAVNLDWVSGAKIAFAITGSSSGTFAVVPEVTVDDLMLSSSPVWIAQSSAPLTANSSVWEISGPLAGIRMNSTALSSAVLTLRLLQDHGN